MKMIGTKKAAELLGISDRRVRKLIAQGRVHGACKIGGSWVIPLINGYPKIKTASRGPKATWKKVTTPTQNIVHINRQLIGQKMIDDRFAPVISIKGRKKNTYSSRVVIPGPCVIVYDFENPHSDCGARAWVESYSQPMPQDGCTYQEIIDRLPQKTKTKFQKAPGKGFAKKSNCPVAA